MLSWKGDWVQVLMKEGKFWSQKVLEMCSKGGLGLHCLLFPALSVCLRMCITTPCNTSSPCVPGWEEQHCDLCELRHQDLAGGVFIPGRSRTVEAVPAHGEGLELQDLSGPFQHKPFYGYVIQSNRKAAEPCPSQSSPSSWEKGKNQLFTCASRERAAAGQGAEVPGRALASQAQRARDAGKEFVFAVGVADFLDHICS